jgi:hypothetical protein
MKKSLIYLILAAVTLLSAFECTTINGPDDNDGNGNGSNGGAVTINALLENGDIFVDFIWVEPYHGNEKNAIAYGKCEKGRLIIELPAIVLEQPFLFLNLWRGTYEERFTGICSDKNTRIATYEWIYGIDKLGIEIEFHLLPITSSGIQSKVPIIGRYYYVDRDVTMKGTYKEDDNYYKQEIIFDLSLKKGWNLVYETYSWNIVDDGWRESSLTTQKPSNLTFGWFWYRNFDLSHFWN